MVLLFFICNLMYSLCDKTGLCKATEAEQPRDKLYYLLPTELCNSTADHMEEGNMGSTIPFTEALTQQCEGAGKLQWSMQQSVKRGRWGETHTIRTITSTCIFCLSGMGHFWACRWVITWLKCSCHWSENVPIHAKLACQGENWARSPDTLVLYMHTYILLESKRERNFPSMWSST